MISIQSRHFLLSVGLAAIGAAMAAIPSTCSSARAAGTDAQEPPPTPPPAPAPQEPPQSSKSQLRFQKDVVELGDTYQEHEYPVEFPFQIEGPDPVVITALETSCGCTEAHLEVGGKTIPIGSALAPETSGVIRATFSSQHFSNRKISVITLRGNAASLPQKLTIQATIHPVFELSPTRVTFGEVLYGAARTEEPVREIAVKAPEAFTVTRWVYVPPMVSIEDTGRAETGPDGKSQTRWFQVRIRKDAAPGRITQSILAETSLGKNLEVILLGEVIGPVKYYPGERILFGMVTFGQAPTRRVKAVVGGPGMTLPEPVVSLHAGDGAFTAAIVDRTPGQQYEIRIDLSAEAPVGKHSAILRLSWPDGSNIEPKEFPINAVVRQPQ